VRTLNLRVIYTRTHTGALWLTAALLARRRLYSECSLDVCCMCPSCLHL
jgi:hypothetical protein